MAKKTTKKANRSDFIEKLSISLGISKIQAEKNLNSVLVMIMEFVAKDYTLNLTGFGSFYKATRKERKGVNPKTGKSMIIKASTSGGFRAGNKFKTVVREKTKK
jgi:DNA-binding protein HU-beta